MKKTIKTESLVEKIVAICDEIASLHDGDVKTAEKLKIELDIYVEIVREFARGANESYTEVLAELDQKTGWKEMAVAACAIAHPIEESELDFPEFDGKSEEPEEPEEPEEIEANEKFDFLVTATQHGKEVFRYKVDSLLTANGLIKIICKYAMKEKTVTFCEIYEKDKKIVTADYISGDVYYYTDYRPEIDATYKMSCVR